MDVSAALPWRIDTLSEKLLDRFRLRRRGASTTVFVLEGGTTIGGGRSSAISKLESSGGGEGPRFEDFRGRTRCRLALGGSGIVSSGL